MKQTIVINLFAGSGTGKSTLAAGLFTQLKLNGINCELAREYVKKWAWDNKIPLNFEDQFYIFGKQSREEAVLYSKVDVVITDSPIWIPAFFESHFFKKIEGYDCALAEMTSRYITNLQKLKNVKFLNFWLDRLNSYQSAGRFETEEQSDSIHNSMRKFLEDNEVSLVALPSSHEERVRIVTEALDQALSANE